VSYTPEQEMFLIEWRQQSPVYQEAYVLLLQGMLNEQGKAIAKLTSDRTSAPLVLPSKLPVSTPQCQCGKVAEWGDRWCQECWEAHCADAFWSRVGTGGDRPSRSPRLPKLPLLAPRCVKRIWNLEGDRT
jgi:hypothetical protein